MGEVNDSNKRQRVELGFSGIFYVSPKGCGKTEFDREFAAAHEEQPNIKRSEGLKLRFFGHLRYQESSGLHRSSNTGPHGMPSE
jgi:hypothetical protein